MTTTGLDQRRQQRTQAKRRAGGLAAARNATAERQAILQDLKLMPLKHLRAIHKAVHQAFPRSR